MWLMSTQFKPFRSRKKLAKCGRDRARHCVLTGGSVLLSLWEKFPNQTWLWMSRYLFNQQYSCPSLFCQHNKHFRFRFITIIFSTFLSFKLYLIFGNCHHSNLMLSQNFVQHSRLKSFLQHDKILESYTLDPLKSIKITICLKTRQFYD